MKKFIVTLAIVLITIPCAAQETNFVENLEGKTVEDKSEEAGYCVGKNCFEECFKQLSKFNDTNPGVSQVKLEECVNKCHNPGEFDCNGTKIKDAKSCTSKCWVFEDDLCVKCCAHFKGPYNKTSCEAYCPLSDL